MRTLLLLTALTVGSAAAASWRVVETPHFVFYSQAGPTTTRSAVDELVHFHHFLMTQFEIPVGERDERLKLRVFMLRGQEAFNTLVGMPGFAGVFQNAQSGPVAVVFHDDKEGANYSDSLRAMKHEYVHHIMRERPTPVYVPFWYSEGAAELFSTFRIEGGQAKIGAGLRQRLSGLQDRGRFLSLPELFAAKELTNSLGAEEINVFYAQAWAVTRMLLLEEDFKANTPMFLKDMAARRPLEEAIAERFGMGVEAFEKHYQKYRAALVRRLKRNKKVQELSIPFDVPQTSVVQESMLPSTEGVWLEHVLMHIFQSADRDPQERLQKAEQAFTASGDPRFLWLQSRILVQEERWGEARALMQVWVDQFPEDPFVNLAAAQLLFDEQEGGSEVSNQSTSTPWDLIDRIDAHLGVALRHDPNDVIARVYQIKNLLYWGVNSMEAVMPHIEDAYALYPQNYLITRFYLEQLFYQKRFDDACQLLRPLAHLSESEGYRRDLQQQLKRIPYQREVCPI